MTSFMSGDFTVRFTVNGLVAPNAAPVLQLFQLVPSVRTVFAWGSLRSPARTAAPSAPTRCSCVPAACPRLSVCTTLRYVQVTRLLANGSRQTLQYDRKMEAAGKKGAWRASARCSFGDRCPSARYFVREGELGALRSIHGTRRDVEPRAQARSSRRPRST
jgi:hypothetical protein